MIHTRLPIRFLLCFFVACCLATSAHSAQRIAFERDGSIYVSDLDGKEPRKLAAGVLPDISPDGTKIAFNTEEESSDTPVRHIAVVDAGSGKVTVFKDVPSPNSFGPAWSPDGKSLLFSTYVEKDWQLAWIAADGTGYRIVNKTGPSRESCSSPCWAADGNSYFCHDLDSIYRYDLQGKQQESWSIHAIVENGDMNSNSRIAVSPDGKMLIMDIDMAEDHNRENWDGPPPAVWLLKFGEPKASRLTPKDFFAWSPAWISNTDFLFLSQGEKENQRSIYRRSLADSKAVKVVGNADTPSVSR